MDDGDAATAAQRARSLGIDELRFVSGLYDEEIEHGFGDIFVKVDDANYATSTGVHLQHRKADNMWVLSLTALESPAVSPVGEPSGTEGSSEPAAEPTAKVATAQTVSLTVGAPKGDLCVAGAPSSPPPPTRAHTLVHEDPSLHAHKHTHTPWRLLNPRPGLSRHRRPRAAWRHPSVVREGMLLLAAEGAQTLQPSRRAIRRKMCAYDAFET